MARIFLAFALTRESGSAASPPRGALTYQGFARLVLELTGREAGHDMVALFDVSGAPFPCSGTYSALARAHATFLQGAATPLFPRPHSDAPPSFPRSTTFA